MVCKKCGFITSGTTCLNCGWIESSKKSWIIFAAIVLVIIIASFMGFKFNTSSYSPPGKMHALFACEDFVKNKLKAPSTADFARYTDTQIEKSNNGSFTVFSYVDAENSFGANIRTHFTCTVKYSVASDRWQLKNLNIN